MMSVRVSRRRRRSYLCECLGGIGVDVVSTVVLRDRILLESVERRPDRGSEVHNEQISGTITKSDIQLRRKHGCQNALKSPMRT
jgi:hypothetical protein